PAASEVVHVSGAASVDGAPLRVGMTVADGAVIPPGPTGFVTLHLAEGTTLTLPRGAPPEFQAWRRFAGSALTASIRRVENGVVESHVAPSGQGVGRFEVRTPVAVTGVRGTRFRVRADTQGVRSEVIDGSVRLHSHASGHSPGAAVAVNK